MSIGVTVPRRRRLRGAPIVAALALFALAGPPSGGAAQSAEQTAAALFSEADALLRMGRLDQARERLQRVLDQYPRAPFPGLVWRSAAAVRLGDLRLRTGATALAGESYVRVLDEELPSIWSARARLGLAAVALGEGDWLTAADLLQRVVTAAELGAADGDAGAADEARRRLTLLDRFRLGPQGERAPWRSAGLVTAPGLELDRPVAVAAAGDGQLLVIDEGLPSVLLIDAERSRTSRLTYNEHTRPWWGFDGLPYLPTEKAGVIALGGSRVGFLADDGGRAIPLKDLQAGVRTPAGRWYLVDFDPRRVLRFGPDGDYQGPATRPGQEPVDVAMDELGRLHVLDREARTVTRLLPDGRPEGVIVRGEWRRPEAVEVDGLGNIYVLDRDGRFVDVFDADGARVTRLGPGLFGGAQLRGPRDVTVDGAGQVYVADRSASSVWVIR